MRSIVMPGLALGLAFLVAPGCGQPSVPRQGTGSTAAPAPPPSPDTTGSAARVQPRAAEEECDEGECGPAMGMPNRKCPDGSIAGPTGRCLRHPDGRCGWEVRKCP